MRLAAVETDLQRVAVATRGLLRGRGVTPTAGRTVPAAAVGEHWVQGDARGASATAYVQVQVASGRRRLAWAVQVEVR